MTQRANIIIYALILAIAQCVGLFVVSLALTLEASAAVPVFCGDTVRGLADHNCAGVDADGDGYTTDGSGWFTETVTGVVDGNQSTTRKLTLEVNADWRLNIRPLSIVNIIDTITGTTVQRKVLFFDSQTTGFPVITFDGDAVSVTDGTVITVYPAEDPDDTNVFVGPGDLVSTGCAAGEVKRGMPDGTFSACATFTCSMVSPENKCKYVDGTSGNDTTGDGSDSTPWKSLHKVGYDAGGSPAGSYSMTSNPGSTVLIRGTVTDPYDSNYNGGNSMMVLRGVGCSADGCEHGIQGAPNRYMGDPRYAMPVLDPNGDTDSVERGPIYIEQSSYVIIEGLEITDTLLNGGQGGIGDSDAHHIMKRRNYIHNTACDQDDNCAAFLSQPDGNGNVVAHNVVIDVDGWRFGAGSNPGKEDTPGDIIRIFQSEDSYFLNNVGVCLTEGPIYTFSGHGFYFKHAAQIANSDYTWVRGNVFANCGTGAQLNNANVIYENNRTLDSGDDHIQIAELGGPFHPNDIVIRNNLLSGGDARGISYVPSRKYDADNTAAADNCSGDTATGPITLSNNVWSGSASAVYALEVYPTGPTAMYDEFIASGGSQSWFSDGNCYYKPSATSATTLFGVFSINTTCDTTCANNNCEGADYSLTSYTAAFPHLETNAFIEDPALNTDGIPTSTNCTGKGWTVFTPTVVPETSVTANGGACGRMRR